MSQQYILLSKNVSHAQLAIISSKEIIESEGITMTQTEIKNLKAELEQLLEAAKRFSNSISSLSSL